MGLFSEKEKSSEEKLVDELVGSGTTTSANIREVLNSVYALYHLQKSVQEAWKNGASVIEIQRIYDEKLLEVKSSYKEIEASSKYKNRLNVDATAKNKLYAIVKEAQKNGATASEIQKVYDENLLKFNKSTKESENKYRKEQNFERNNELLEKYPNINELDQILQTCMDLMGSIDIEEIAYNQEKYYNLFEEKKFTKSTISNEVKNEFPSVNHAYTILNKPKFFGDTITNFLYEQLVFLVFQILIYREKSTFYQDVYPLAHKIMILLYDFDKEIAYKKPDETFFQALKEVKWNKNAEKFQNKIKDIYKTSIIGSTGRLSFISFGQNINHVIPFLGACNAIKNQRKTIENEDVIIAFKTYFKFCDFKLPDEDIDKSEVLEKVDNSDNFNESNEIDILDETAIPEPIDKFLNKTGLKLSDAVNLSPDYKNVVIAKEKLKGIFNFDAWIYMAVFDEVSKSIIEDFGTIAYTKHNYYYKIGYGTDKIFGDHRESVFTIFFVKQLLEEDLPNIIKKDWMLGQIDKAMIYNIENNTLYGKNGIHMKKFKEIIEEWGIIETCNNNNYFKVKIL